MTRFNEPNEHEWASDDPYQVADDLKAGLESALYQLDLKVDVPEKTQVEGFYPDNIRVNKLSYRAIEDMDLPLIRTWYRYGQFEPYISLRAENLNPRPLKKPEKEVTTMDTGSTIKRKTIRGYFLSQKKTIKRIWEQKVFDFMNDNYVEFAPREFDDLYCANTGVLKALEDTFIDYSQDLWIDADSFLEASMDLRYELNSNPELTRETKEHVSKFLYSFEDALTALENLDEFTSAHTGLLKTTRHLYHEYIWKLPAMEISVENTEGPDKEVNEYDSQRKEYLDRFRDHYPNHLQRWERKIDKLELNPNTKTYKSVYGEIPEEIGALEKAATTKDYESV